MSKTPSPAPGRPAVPAANRPHATVTIEPIGSRQEDPRDHSIHVRLDLGASDPRHADRDHVAGIARAALAVAPQGGHAQHDQPVSDVATSKRSSRAGGAGTASRNVVGVEGTSVWRGRPTEGSIERLRDLLVAGGYRVAIREKRECGEPACRVHAVMDWDRSTEIPPRWHSDAICGEHNYRTCSRCKSIYTMSSVNAAGQAPSVHCEVCGQVIVEWGGSKIWTATLVNGNPPSR